MTTFRWQGQAIAFRAGDTLATALIRAGIVDLGAGRAVFCGIGQCQGCLVRSNGRLVEACLTPCRAGLDVSPQTRGEHG